MTDLRRACAPRPTSRLLRLRRWPLPFLGRLLNRLWRRVCAPRLTSRLLRLRRWPLPFLGRLLDRLWLVGLGCPGCQWLCPSASTNTATHASVFLRRVILGDSSYDERSLPAVRCHRNALSLQQPMADHAGAVPWPLPSRLARRVPRHFYLSRLSASIAVPRATLVP